MNINKTTTNEKTIISLEGRLDTTTAPQLQPVLVNEFDISKDIELNFEDLVYVSSAGLRVLLMGEKTAKAKSGRMTLTNVSNEILEVFDITGFLEILNIR